MKVAFFQYFELFSLLLAIFLSKRLKLFRIGAFIPLLFVVNMTETIGINHKFFGWKNNYLIYNIYLVISTSLMLQLFYEMLIMNRKMQQVFQTISILLILFLLINILFVQGFAKFNTLSLVLISVLNIVLSSIVLFQLVFYNNVDSSLFKEPFFWINAGILFFSLGTVVLFGLQQTILHNHIQIEGKSLYRVIAPFLNVILYSAWSYGFIQCNRKSLS